MTGCRLLTRTRYMAQAAAQQSTALGVRTLLLKGISAADGSAYALRRVDPRQARAPSKEESEHMLKCYATV